LIIEEKDKLIELLKEEMQALIAGKDETILSLKSQVELLKDQLDFFKT